MFLKQAYFILEELVFSQFLNTIEFIVIVTYLNISSSSELEE
jgi:hypothetical protein